MESFILFNLGTWALTLTEEKRLNAYHQKQLLKKILNIRYPKKIKKRNRFTESATKKAQSLQILSARWRLFGHVLRRDQVIYAIKAIRAYFIPIDKKLRGRPKTNLPIVLNRHLTLIQHPSDKTQTKTWPRSQN